MATLEVNPNSLHVSRIVSRAATNDKSTMNTLKLSTDGNYFAVGFRSGLLEIHDTFHFRIYRQFSLGNTIVTALAWHPTFPRTLAAGTKNGNLHLFKFGGDPEDDFCERIKFMGYISDVAWGPNAKQLAVIYSMSVALISDPVSANRAVSRLNMSKYMVVNNTSALFCLPLELHYLDEHVLLIVLLAEVIAISTAPPHEPLWSIDSIGTAYFGHIAISPDRLQLASANLAECVDRYSISKAAWVNSHSVISDEIRGTQASRLYGLAYLDSKTVIAGYNGSHIAVIHDTRREGDGRYTFSTFRLAAIERLTHVVVTGVIRNRPVILAINGEGGASQIYVVSAEYSDPKGLPTQVKVQALPPNNNNRFHLYQWYIAGAVLIFAVGTQFGIVLKRYLDGYPVFLPALGVAYGRG